MHASISGRDHIGPGPFVQVDGTDNYISSSNNFISRQSKGYCSSLCKVICPFWWDRSKWMHNMSKVCMTNIEIDSM